MKIIYSLVSCIIFALLVCCSSSCRKAPPYRTLILACDSTWIIPENDSVTWKQPQSREDTLRFEVTREYGPSTGRVVLSAYKTGEYTDIRKDTTFSINWYWKTDKCDTVVFKIVNTSSSDTLKVRAIISRFVWNESSNGFG
ncbi:MAG: hypothetical protein WC614_08615 [bacterium]